MSKLSRRLRRGNAGSLHAHRTLPWSSDEYVKLGPADFEPTLPTPLRRIRVAAAVATRIRDEDMQGQKPGANAEAVRALLVAEGVAWARDIESVREYAVAYDPVDPFVRFEQVKKAWGGG